MSQGKLIVIEGLEGAGKSTAIQTVLACLDDHKIPNLTTREPGGTVIGELLRDIIKNPAYKEQLHDKSELLLLYAARIQLLEEVIKPALAQGIWVVADRFEFSTFAYQGGGRCLDLDFIQSLSSFSMNGFQANLVFYLDIHPEEGMKRACARGALDRIEQQTMDFFHRVHQSYLQQVQMNPHIKTIDASLPLFEVQKSIHEQMQQFLKA